MTSIVFALIFFGPAWLVLSFAGTVVIGRQERRRRDILKSKIFAGIASPLVWFVAWLASTQAGTSFIPNYSFKTGAYGAAAETVLSVTMVVTAAALYTAGDWFGRRLIGDVQSPGTIWMDGVINLLTAAACIACWALLMAH